MTRTACLRRTSRLPLLRTSGPVVGRFYQEVAHESGGRDVAISSGRGVHAVESARPGRA